MNRLLPAIPSTRRAAEAGFVHWFALGILVLGTALLTAAWLTYSESVERLETYVRAEGVVTGFFADRDAGEDADVYFPIVDFTTAEGQRVRFKDSVGTGYSPGYEEDESVTVLYDPRSPGSAMIESSWGLWMAPIILCILGLAALAWGGGLVWLVLQDPPWKKENRARKTRKRGPLRPPLPWRQLVPIVVVALAGGTYVALRLPYLPGMLWIVCSCVLTLLFGMISLFSSDFIPRALFTAAAAQIPLVGLRLALGDPEVRLARAWVEEMAARLRTSDSASNPLEDGGVVSPDVPELRGVLDNERIRFGTRDGRFVVVFSRTVYGYTETHTYDLDSKAWAKSDWEDTTPLDEVNVYAP